MPQDIQFVAGAELETLGGNMWTDTPLASSSAPVSGISGAHGRVYTTSVWPLLRVAFAATPVVTAKTWFRFENNIDNQPFMHLLDGATEQLQVVYRSSGLIEVKRQTTVLASGGSFAPNTNYQLEWRARISNGAGTVAFNVNGDQVICIPSGADTQVSGSGQVTHWSVGSDELGAYFDNCALDRAGSYLGTGLVETLMPNGIGDLSQLVPSAVAANYSLVDEKPHDSDITYVESTGDQIDTYTFEDRSISGTPLAVKLACAVRGPGTGDPGLRLVCRIDGENFESPTFSGIESTYRDHRFHVWNVNPATGEPWTDGTINAAQWGQHCLASGLVITQLGLQIYVKQGESDQCLLAGNKNYCLSVDNDFN